MRIAILYFTGTGNTEFAAREYAAAFGPENRTELRSIERLADAAAELARSAEIVGFGSPVYGFAAARPMLDFLRRLPPAPGKRAFVFVTCGGMAGAALRAPTGLLRGRGYDVVEECALSMPSNVFIKSRDGDELVLGLLGGGERMSIGDTLERCRADVRASAGRILGGSGARVPAGIGARLNTALVGPMIQHTGWSMRFQVRVTRECNRCGRCVSGCPAGNIRLGRRGISYGWNCYYCLRCLNLCPRHAIHFRFPFTAFDNRAQYLCPGWQPPQHDRLA